VVDDRLRLDFDELDSPERRSVEGAPTELEELIASHGGSIEHMFDRRPVVTLEGRIAASGFSTGHRIVVGSWDEGPLGPMTDVMCADPSGRRTLLASSDAVARFVGGVYSFDATAVVEFEILESNNERIALRAGSLEIDFHAGTPSRIFSLRPRWLRRRRWWARFEDAALRPLAGTLVLRGVPGVRAFGVSPSGVSEWYRIDAYRPLVAASASVRDRDLGQMAPLDPPAGFGFSEFPRVPALVTCSPVLAGADRYLPRPAPHA
jgi:hypothetical protein